MRELIASNKDLAALERGHDRTASVIEVLVEDIDRLALKVKQLKALPEPRIGASVSSSETTTRRIGHRQSLNDVLIGLRL